MGSELELQTNAPSRMKHVDAAVFDLDGTLVDTDATYIADLMRRTFDKFRIPFSEEHVAHIMYDGNRDTYVRQRFGINMDDFWKEFVRLSEPTRHAAATHPYPDAAVVNRLRTLGIKTAIVTGGLSTYANAIIPKVGTFDAVVCANPTDGLPRKPHPLSIQVCLDRLGVKAQNAVYLGNGDEDAAASQAANVRFIHVCRPTSCLAKHNGFPIISNLHELETLLRP